MSDSKTNCLSLTRVIYIHYQLVKKFGGLQGIRDIRLVESAIARSQTTFDGTDQYKNIFNKAAALLKSLLKNHPFVDGNKRTALTSSGLFLKMNGWNLINNHNQEAEFAIKVDNQNLTHKDISKWLKDHSEKISKK